MKRLIDVKCSANCGVEQVDVWVGLEYPTCNCGAPMERLWTMRGSTAAVIGDDIPGGYDVRHGLCHADGSPRRFYSKSEIFRAAKEKGLVNAVRHATDPTSGSDKAKFTTRWY